MAKVLINGIKLFYKEKGAGEPLLFLHGLGSCGQDWLFQAPLFSKTHHIFLPDLRGHGESGKKGPFTIQQCSDDMAEFIKQLSIGPVHIVGLSFGSFVALQLALDHPSLVKSITLSGTTSRIKDIGYWQLLLRAAYIFCCSMKRIGSCVAKMLFPKPKQKALFMRCSKQLSSNNKKIYKAYCMNLWHFDVYSRLHTLSCPVLLIVGENDSLLPYHHIKKMKDRIAMCTCMILKNSHHASPIDCPDKFNAALSVALKASAGNLIPILKNK